MTCLEKLLRANRWRIKTGKTASSDLDGWNGTFLVPLEGSLFFVMIGDGMGWRHLSISNAQRKVLPSYTVMARIKACFFGDDAWVVHFYPPPEEHINDNPYVLHLWESIDEPQPHPTIMLV